MLAAGGSYDEALAADAAIEARWEAERLAADQLVRDRAERRRLDLVEQRQRIKARERRERRRADRGDDA